MQNLDLSRVKKEYLVLGYIVIAGLVVFSIYANVFNPLLGRIKTASLQIEKKQRDIQRAQISPQDLRKQEEQIKNIEQQIAYYQGGLRSRIDVTKILQELTQIAEGLQIKFISVEPLERKVALLPKSEDLLVQIPIKISLQCGYHQLGIFISHIENSHNFMKITELKIKAGGKDLWAHQVELVITSYLLSSQQKA